MMIVRIYGLLWVLAAIVGGVLYLSDSFNAITSIIFGFIVAALAGAALLVVFPVVMTKRVSSGREAGQS